MKEQIVLGGEPVNYVLRLSDRAKYLRAAVYPGGEVIVTAPKRASARSVSQFLQLKAGWLLHAVKRLRSVAPRSAISNRAARYEFLKHRVAARELVLKKVAHFNSFYNFRIGTVSIRNQKTRWGSCSKAGDLNFNYKIVKLPERLVDLIIVHELCHLAEMNHSRRFWLRVAEQIPEYKDRTKELKKWSLAN